jgi:hypothetical protein
MGYFKNLEIELQEIQNDELRQIVAWDKANKHRLSPEERWRILTNEVLLKRALVLWENETIPSPKPASEHLALQVSRRDLRQPKKSYRCLIGWTLIGLSATAGMIILGVNIW